MSPLERKLGPLPAYAWAGIAVAVILVVVYVRKSRQPQTMIVADPQPAADPAPSPDVSTASDGGMSEYANTGDIPAPVAPTDWSFMGPTDSTLPPVTTAPVTTVAGLPTATATAVKAPSYPTLMYPMGGQGHPSSDVHNMQKILGLYPDGVYTLKVQAAVANKQKRLGMVPTGIADPKFLKAIGFPPR